MKRNSVKKILRSLSVAALVSLPGLANAAGPTVEILTTGGCSCCLAWARHLQEQGYATDVRQLPSEEFQRRKLQSGVKPDLASCHTGLIGGYVIEGHVPAREIARLLSERPDAVGLAVPDMPIGSPGMGEGSADAEPYDVLLLRKDGTTQVFARYR
ncbi:DUF411 domain-containing protein [Labrys sp. LIt4]|uniref:DUF411 domain-containing protein n=1 Tax=Labrys sp. LIt4 TaxID=2821355 RepID=UPI001AE090E0|nr:DUF411 domain-containing protein [Labrys sp. LIt4]MBP0581352.1 DUF411 domain-containing protein [Labrys sp. LIt4]